VFLPRDMSRRKHACPGQTGSPGPDPAAGGVRNQAPGTHTLQMTVLTPKAPAYTRPPMEAGSETRTLDASEALLDGLRSAGATYNAALDRLHALLLRGAHHELRRRSAVRGGMPREEIDDLAHHAAHDAMTAILAKLDSFRGESRFTTWVYKFVILEAGVKARRRAWRDREITLDDEGWRTIGDSGQTPERSAETGDLLRKISEAVGSELTPRQRQVFTALAVNEVPIDVLAERLDTTRGALYKTLHDARRKLRVALADAGYALGDDQGGGR